MPADAVFLDSNVVLYLLSGDARKAGVAEALLRERPTISVQVLNEVTHVCRRKLKLPWAEVDEIISLVTALCTVVPLTQSVHEAARRVAQRHGLAFYDACIVAAAAEAGCQWLYSEDMHDGLQVAGLNVCNPFRQPDPKAGS